MRSPVAFAAALSLTALLAACGAPSAPTSAAPAQAAVPDLLVSAQEFGRLAHVRPSDVAYLIDGDSATVYQLQYASTLSGAAVGGGNVTVQSLKPVTQVVHTSQEVFAPLQAQAATCGGSDGPYYKSVFQGAVGFRHDMILPPSTSVPRSGSAAFLYGGYAASTTNVEIGFQRL